MNGMDLNGQTAPESTHGLFGPPAELKIDKRRSAIEFSKSSTLDFTSQRSQSVYGIIPSSHHRLSTQQPQQQQRSALHTVNEEDGINRNRSSSSATSTSSSSLSTTMDQRSSILYFNETSIGQYNKRRSSINNDFRRYSSSSSGFNQQQLHDENESKRMSRADALAEAEAKLNGYGKKLPSTLFESNRSSSRPTSLRPLHAFNNNNQHYQQQQQHNNNKLLSNGDSSSSSSPSAFQQEQKQNRRLSEPNARQYFKYSDQYNEFQEMQQRKSQRMSMTSSPFNNNHHQNSINNRRTSLQLLNASTASNTNHNHNGLEGRRSGTKPSHLLLDTNNNNNNNENRRSRNFNNDWRSSTYSVNGNAGLTGNNNNNNGNGGGTAGDRSSVYGFVPFTPTRMSFSREDNTIQQQLQQRRALFTPHLPFSALAPFLKSHQLVSGMLRVNKRNRSDAYVFCETFNADIYICGSRDRNRALEGDHVVVRLVEVERVMREKMEKEEAKLARNNGLPVIRKPDEEDEKEIIFGGEEDVDKVTPRYCGIITAVLERAQNQMFSGTLGLMRPNSKRQHKHGHDDDRDNSPRIIWFKPTDKRVPLIAIPVDQAPVGFLENSQAYENTLFLGSIKRWPITSLHPFGVLEAELGSVDQLDVQFRGILADNNFLNNKFKNDVMACLPSLPWNPSKESLSHRRDLRSLRCFTIDNQENGENDVALSIEKMGDGYYQVGLHVSDFTSFVKPQSPIDKEARDRASGIYLHKSVPLWPAELLKHCTDLLPNQDRYAFSVIWKFNDENKIIDTWFGKTIIRSYALVVPNEIQDSLMNNSSIIPEHIGAEGAKDLKKLYDLSQRLKEKRLQDGALFLAEQQLDIEMMDELPVDIAVKPELMSSDILNEFKVLANTMVAQKITRGLPEAALLQSQAPPNERKLLELTHYLQSVGYHIDPTSSKTLQASVDAIENVDARSVITTLVLKTMQPKKYFCTGAFDISRYHHYSKNVPLYTDFTSPSRKYASIIVHRQLETVLQGGEDVKFYLESDYVQKLAQHCNAKEACILNAQEQSQHLLLSNYLTSSKQTSITHEAIVVGVQEQTFDVIVPSLGLERRIHVMNLPLRHSHYQATEGVLYLYWLPGVPTTDALVEKNDDYDDEEDDDIRTRTTDDDDYSFIDGHSDEKEKEKKNNESESKDKIVQQLAISESNGNQQNNNKNEVVTTTKRRPRSLSLRAIEGESMKSQQKCTIPQECCLLIRPFDFIRVVIIADSIRNPPLVRVLASNPFVNHES
ncbi:hypothetical protein BJ944DRAFT_288196 [Cunninghamella echinulata]|nr:hypothetical protein BJ944DRAFT_288196 [Cunninghamella echinulata]